MWTFINLTLAIGTGFVIYNTSLSFLGQPISLKRTIFPVILFTITLCVSKFWVQTPPVLHIVTMVISCGIYMFLFTKMSFIICLIGSLLTAILVMIDDMVLIKPLILLGKLHTDYDFNNLNWIIINLIEVSFPITFLIVNKVKPVSKIYDWLK